MAYVWGKLCLYAGSFSGLIVTFNPHPFASGSTKQSHEGRYGYEAPKEKYGQLAVVKKNIDNHKSQFQTRQQFKHEILTHKITAKYANIWNGFYSKSIQKSIAVTIPYMTQINSISDWFHFNKHSDGEYILVEDYLQGTFEKFNSNTGWFDEHQRNAMLLNAFSHWTYHYSNGKYLVCDLQGVCEGTEYRLTDPVIMSNDKQFGNTDLGTVGISNWFFYHKCNEYCNENWRKPEKIEKCEDIDCDKQTSHLNVDFNLGFE